MSDVDGFDINALYQAVGYYLSSVATIESYVDLIIEREFKILLPDETKRFRTWITSNLSLRSKVHAALKILEHHGVLDEDRRVKRDLEDVLGRRDFLAHAQLVPTVVQDGEDRVTSTWTLEFQQARGDRGVDPADAVAINAQAHAARELAQRVSALWALAIERQRSQLEN